jgi:triosephosphate isomerase
MSKYCIANWKMYMDISKIDSYFIDFLVRDFIYKCNIVICPSSIHINYVSELIKSNQTISLGAQNVSEYDSGAYTGEHSLKMLIDSDCKYSIIGHSERRQFCGETDSNVNNKLRILNYSDIIPIICIGETFEENDSGITRQILENQLKRIFNNIELNNSKDCIIAYEPIWAIGTGKSANVETIYSVHKFLKNIINEINTNNCNICLLYGGSVNEDNAKEIFEINEVDCFLIGSASINAAKFYNIYNKF